MTGRDSLETELDGILARDPIEVRAKESSLFDRLTGIKRDKLVLCGAGGLGRKILAGLRHVGVEPLCFADNNRSLAGRELDGLRVLTPSEVAARFGREAAFVVTIWGAHSKDRLADRKKQWEQLGCDTVISFMSLFWKFPEEFLPHYSCDLPHKVFAQSDLVKKAYSLWSDDPSRAEFNAQVRWRTQLDFDGLPAPKDSPAYFPADIIHLKSDEEFVDCGAFDGDTLRDFLHVSGGQFKSYWGFEPDPVNFAKLAALLETLPLPTRQRITISPFAANNRKETLRFAAGGTAASALDPTGGVEVAAERLDVLLAGASPSFIKMDIEGAEPAAINGCAGLVSKVRPVFAVSAYHLQEHLWELPLLLASRLSDYCFFLRPHDLEGWDLVLYAIPRERCAVGPGQG